MFSLSRRTFTLSFASSLAYVGFPKFGFANATNQGKLVVIILEGGLDGLAAVPPIGDPQLLKYRRLLLPENNIKIGSFFALHPSFSGFVKMLAKGEASIIHATSFPYTRRSHFEGQNVVESGSINPFVEKTGWLGRAMDIAGLSGRAMALDMPLLARGNVKVDNFFPANLKGSFDPTIDITRSLSSYFGNAEAHKTIKRSIDGVERKYQNAPKFFSRDPAQLALQAGKQMDKDDGPVAAIIRVHDFDTHSNQGADSGQHADQMRIVDDIFVNLKKGLGPSWKNSVALTLTEFGRTVRMNGSSGTDHGYGTVGLLAGGLLGKSSVVADWPDMKKLFEGRDLHASIDYRAVCAACIERAFLLDHKTIASKVFFDPNLKRISDQIFV